MKPAFEKTRIKLPWRGWEDIEITPEGIHTPRGLLSPGELDLLFWKASFYDRGMRRYEEEILLAETEKMHQRAIHMRRLAYKRI